MNWPTVTILIIVAAIFISIVARGIYNKKKGKKSCSCGCSCGGCAMNEICHENKKID